MASNFGNTIAVDPAKPLGSDSSQATSIGDVFCEGSFSHLQTNDGWPLCCFVFDPNGWSTLLSTSWKQQCWEHLGSFICWFRILGEARVEGYSTATHQAVYEANFAFHEYIFVSIRAFQRKRLHVTGSVATLYGEQWLRERKWYSKAWYFPIWWPCPWPLDEIDFRCLLWCFAIFSSSTFVRALVASQYC